MTPEATMSVGYRCNELTIPERLRRFAEPALIVGESREDYELLRQLLIEDIQPRSNLEWLWLFDLAELSWEILRYRKLKVRAIEMYRARAIEAILLRMDGAAIPTDSELLRKHTKKNVADWQNDPLAAFEIEARLMRFGFDLAAINAEANIQAQAELRMFEALLHGAQARRITLVKEIKICCRRQI